jgi:hypothetical protein
MVCFRRNAPEYRINVALCLHRVRSATAAGQSSGHQQAADGHDFDYAGADEPAHLS